MAEVNKNIDNVKTKKTEILQKTWVVCALALVCTFLWGSASPCIKLGYAFFRIPSGETWTQVLFAGMRFVLAGILTVLIGSLLQRKVLVPTTASAPSIVKLAIFQTILQYIFFYIGLAHNSGVKASIINGSNTFFVILVSALIFRQEKLDLKKVLGCIIGFAGVIVVSMNGQKIDMDLSLMGDGSLFLCALSYAVSSCLMKCIRQRIAHAFLSGMYLRSGIFLVGYPVKIQSRLQSSDFRIHEPGIRCPSVCLVAGRGLRRTGMECFACTDSGMYRYLYCQR